MKKVVCALAILATMLFVVSPLLAQGPFTDVPTDHWAYQAVDQLTKDGIIVGYPDGTFGGKRAMTRFEFAQALARAIPVIASKVQTPPAMAAQPGVTADQLGALDTRVTALENKKPEVTKADLDLLTKTVNEFKDELTAMGVDVDALKRDVASLDKRVSALEKEVSRVRIGGIVNTFAVGEMTSNAAVDINSRPLNPDNKLLQGISFVKEVDLSIDGKVSDNVKAHVLINAGNYLSYLGHVDTEDMTTRPVSGDSDEFTPYYAYIDAGIGMGTLTAGRFPMQWTPYTLKMIDPDYYTVNAKTDSGDFPLDGAKLALKFSSVGVQMFASKVDENLNLDAKGISQLAGARVTISPSSMKGSLSGTYIQTAIDHGAGPAQDGTREWGADANVRVGKIGVGAAYTKTDEIGTGGFVTDNARNAALDANLATNLGGVDVKAGWKSIGENFDAPGSWDKIGRFTNPVNVKGPYANVKYGISSKLSLVAGAEILKGRDNDGALPAALDSTNDKINYYNAGLKWGLGASNSLDLSYDWVNWNPGGSGEGDTNERYYTIGVGHSFSPGAMLKLTYQIIDYKAGSGESQPWGSDNYKGDLAIAQFMVKF